MKIFKMLLLLQLTLSYGACYSQKTKMSKEVEEIIMLGKDSIVQLALALIDKKIDPQNFSSIKIMSNEEQVYVSFMNPIKYLPIKSAFYFDLGVAILEQTITYSPVFNGVDETQAQIPFYIPTKEAEKNIQFVIEAINKSNEIDAFDPSSFDDDMIIREHENYYAIHVISETTESSYKIEKTSGNIYDMAHAHLAPPPFD
ncbi:hypothetical protein N7E81_16665 [Reichenbachiella carrageenanivorans]|uniref:Lipoprotein n=1 Tax=Reichenbachiella carrageenanivorans TaxID=2979869 RepID=A0ABY6D1P6_9BACT|nr:hypothetical protein [Reichenbachiella carrageenanivorans]UXX78988.1 hypothetical protein N7E81_16665 [Reichenbachiella carrageenanivorans]